MLASNTQFNESNHLGEGSMDIVPNTSATNQETATFKGEEFVQTQFLRDSSQFIGGDSELTGDVRKILARPKAITKWDMSTSAPEYVLDWDFFHDKFNLGERFAGALGFRASVHFRFVFAVPPQVGGRVRAVYNPARQAFSSKIFTSYRDFSFMDEVGYFTQLPGSEIDLASATAMDLKVPYTTFFDFFPIRSGPNDKLPELCLGAVKLYNYLPVAMAVGADPVYCTVYTWLEDIEVMGARNPDLQKVVVQSTPQAPVIFGTTSVPSGYVDGVAGYVNNTNLNLKFDGQLNGTGPPGPDRAEISVLRKSGLGFIGAVKVYDGDGNTESYPVTGFTANSTTATVTWVESSGTKNAAFGVVAAAASTIEPQSGVMRSAMEEDVENDGPLSGPLYATSKVAGTVSKYIPLLSSVAGPLSWATRIASNVVSAFGYSRPLQLEQNARFWQSQNHYQNNADGPDTAFNLGLLQDNKVCVIDNGGGTPIDEMAIEYIATKPACVSRFQLSPGSSGFRYGISLCPNAMYSLADIGNNAHYNVPFEWTNWTNANYSVISSSTPLRASGQVIDTTPNFMLGTMFRYFRGGFRFRVKVNKTRFHAGRLALVFTPYSVLNTEVTDVWVPTDGSSVGSTTDLLGHSMIWDLREDAEVVFDCPYIYPKPYCEYYEPYGIFTISVVDNLSAPENVANTLTFAVEVEALSGFEYAYPQQSNYIVDPMIDYRSQEIGGGVEPLSTEIQPQSGNFDSGCPFPTDKTDMSCECIGERILSVKQLLSRAEWTTMNTLIRDQKLEGLTSPVRLPAWFEAPCYVGTKTADGSAWYHYGSYKKSTHHPLLFCYLFARGSTNYDIISYDKTPNSGDVTYQRPETLITFADEASPEVGLLGSGSVIIEEGPFLHAKAPFYSLTKKLSSLPFVDDVDSLPNGLLKSQKSQAFGTPYYYGPNNSKVSIRAGDDAQLSYFLCTPRMCYAEIGPFTISGTASAIGGSVDGGQLAPRFQR